MKSDNKFSCDCGGPIIELSNNLVKHACSHKYVLATSYYDGIDKFMEYECIQINPDLTDGEVKYNWFVKWMVK